MSVINFNQLFNQLSDGVESIAKDSVKDYEAEAKADGQKALTDVKGNLQQWVKELETGSITREDMSFLLQEETALNRMIALKQAGLAAVHIDTFRNDIINMIVSTVTGLIKV